MRTIAFIIPNLQMGGAERALISLANEWVETADVTIITFDEGTSFFKIDSRVKIFPLHSTSTSYGILSPVYNVIKRFFGLPKALKRITPDVAIPFMDTSIIWTCFAKLLCKVQVIMVFQVTPSHAILHTVLRPFRKLLYKRTEAAVVLTEGTFEIFDELKVKLPSRKYVIPNAINSDIINQDQIFRENVILGVGRLADQKRFDVLIELFDKLKVSDWKLWIVGEGSKRPELERMIGERHLENTVILMGAQKEIGRYYAGAKIFAMTSDFEGYPVALCEAMGNGCACISYDCETGPSELIEHNENGFLIEDKNEDQYLTFLIKLIQEPETINRLSTNARKVFDKLNVKKVLKLWEAVVEDVATNK